MQAPLWKRILSHIVEFPIETTSSTYNPELYVCLSRGRYQLCTENAIYSFGDLYDNFSIAFEKIQLDQISGKEVLILGFGIGSIPIILEKMDKKYRYTAVEIDQEIINLATKYTLDGLQSTVELICADAAVWVEQSEQKFDLIAVDLFLDDVIPVVFEQTAFLKNLERLLQPNGLLLFNRLAYTPNDEAKAKDFFEKKFQPVFPNGTHLSVKGNWILVNERGIVNGKR